MADSPGIRTVFVRHAPGRYTAAAARTDFGPGLQRFDEPRLEVVTGSPADPAGRAVRALYPAGKIGSTDSGAEFKVHLAAKPEYYCDYHVRFDPGFPFVKGGKLPGLAGGKANSGGHPARGDGWSTRFMWKERGTLILYVYHLGQAGKYGDAFRVPDVVFGGGWVRLTQRVRVNDPGAANGVVQVWVDGVFRYQKTDFAFRTGDAAPVDRFLFSTFFGGSTPDWAPPADCHARFGDFVVDTARPAGLGEGPR